MDDSIRQSSDRVPPGQYVTAKWPVLTHGATPVLGADEAELEISGLVTSPSRRRFAELERLPRISVLADFHCVTRFSTLDNDWSGFSTRSLLEGAGVEASASHVMVHCHGGYTTNMPLQDFLSERALLADRHGGEPLEVDHGGPLRLVVPHLYAWKSAKWVQRIELLSSDERGFWERNGYHTYGDPWQEQRFSSQETTAAYQVRRSVKEEL